MCKILRNIVRQRPEQSHIVFDFLFTACSQLTTHLQNCVVNFVNALFLHTSELRLFFLFGLCGFGEIYSAWNQRSVQVSHDMLMLEQ